MSGIKIRSLAFWLYHFKLETEEYIKFCETGMLFDRVHIMFIITNVNDFHFKLFSSNISSYFDSGYFLSHISFV